MLLDDLTVVEMTVHRAGPFCGSILADMGADVVKVERPGAGDPSRVQGPGPEGKSGYFTALNRNKRSVTLDLKSDAGREAALELLADADVFVENFGYGVADRLGVGYEDVKAVNDDIVYASVKGYGNTGPLREKPGLDLILQAEGGIMSVTGPEGGDPVKVGQAIGDITAGMFAAIGVLARLHERDRDDVEATGGQFDVGLFDAIVSLMNEYLTIYGETGEVPGPQGTSHQTMVPYQLFETADGSVVTGVPGDDRWDDFVEAVGREELSAYPTNYERAEHEDEVIPILEEAFREHSTEYWLDRLTEYGFPNGPLNDVADIVDHDHARARELVVDYEDDDWGDHVLPGFPVNFPDRETGIRSPAPRLGEHTDEVFDDLAADQTTLDEWRAGGAFGDD